MQLSLEEPPILERKVPASQKLSQNNAPVSPDHEPGGQGRQDAREPTGAYEPGRHLVGARDRDGQNEPGGHASGSVASLKGGREASAFEAMSHGGRRGQKLPGGQSRHDELDSAPRTFENVPLGHGIGCFDFGGQKNPIGHLTTSPTTSPFPGQKNPGLHSANDLDDDAEIVGGTGEADGHSELDGEIEDTADSESEDVAVVDIVGDGVGDLVVVLDGDLVGVTVTVTTACEKEKA